VRAFAGYARRVLDPATYLPGTWRVRRALHDAALGDGVFDGTATFARDGAALAWTESGRLRIGGYDGPARRALRIVPAADGWEVCFDDGRPFHPLTLEPVEHRCRDDDYVGRFAVEGPEAFTVSWRVRGPRKEQRLDARYERA
jgi:hypothetical protein